MKISLVFLGTLFSFSMLAQSVTDVAVQLAATVQVTPPQVILGWIGNAGSSNIQVYRMPKGGGAWGLPIATLPGTATQFTDNNVAAGNSYEYYVRRQGSGYAGHGYINAGIEVPPIESRGRAILIVDSTFTAPLAGEISRLVSDIEGDGWEVVRHDVLRSASVAHVKSLIVAEHDTLAARHAVFLLGHVAVPYSGNLNPDGHSDHLGAWPADVFYGDIDGMWTDNTVNSTLASPPRTQNKPGDGKFDQSVVPGDVEFQVGRVDFYNVPAFAAGETQLLKNYLDKDHEYRKKIYQPQRRAVIDDNFGYFSGEAFAASAYKNFATLVGSNQITTADYFTALSAGSYLWSYGCGGGTYTSAGGVGNTAGFSAANLEGTFTMLFGSYFGDWDVPNNFLRAPLAQGRTLASMWSGRPHFALHHMALGENIGYSLLATQNGAGPLYFGSTTAITGKWIHNALMGDPTLRNDVVAPVSDVVATVYGSDCHVSWTASTETNIAGYHIYMKNDSAKSFVRLNAAPVTSTSFTHNCLLHKGVHTYMVRTLKLEQVASGSYYNLSEGISDTALHLHNLPTIAEFTAIQTGADSFSFSPLSSLSVTHFWDFGDGNTSNAGNPVYAYQSAGSFPVTHIAVHACASDTAVAFVSPTTSLDDLSEDRIIIHPNPTRHSVFIDCAAPLSISITDVSLRVMNTIELSSGGHVVDLSYLPAGIYYLRCDTGNQTIYRRVIRL